MDLVMKSSPLGAQEGTQRNPAPMLTCGKTTVGYQPVTMSFSYKAEVGGTLSAHPLAAPPCTHLQRGPPVYGEALSRAGPMDLPTC